jgi:hypothetical protein
VWDDICGWYSVPGRLIDARVREMTGAGVEVFVRGGRLLLRVLGPIPVLYRGLPLHPDDDTDPFAFRIDLTRFGIGTARVVFSREPRVTAVHFDLMPLSARKQPAMTNPRPWVTGALGALAIATSAIAVRRRHATRVHGAA